MLDLPLFADVALFSFCWIYFLVSSGDILSFLSIGFNAIWYDADGTMIKKQSLFWKAVQKVLFGCERCLAGQIAFWTYFVQFDYSFVNHVLFVTQSIVLAAFLGSLYKFLR